jgi:hypothetical protein
MRMRLVWVLASGLVAALVGACDDDDATPPGGEKALAGNPDGKDDGADCRLGVDCKSGVCIGRRCQPATFDDGVRNGDESDVDCGGSAPSRCNDGQRCLGGSDCASGVCDAEICQAATANDGVKNGDETDVDCGGSTTGAKRCDTGQGCAVAADCESQVCGPSQTCAAPSATDGVKNGDESDVDCGGTVTNAPRCSTGKSCNMHADCASDGCAYDKKCALARSCTRRYGGVTCGAGEIGQGGAKHESCCASRPVSTGAKLDKYQVTAGRMRAFIERTNGNVLGWYESEKAQLSEAARAQIEPYKAYLPQNERSFPMGALYQLGGFVYLPTRPSASQGCSVGNAERQDYGSHTYWNGALEQDDRGLSKDELDSRSLNCVAYPLMAAFCAWDGGRLQTNAEHDAAWGAAKYPWGASPIPGGFRLIDTQWVRVSGDYPSASYNQPCPTCDITFANWGSNYQWPAGGDPARPWDLAYFISSPGRFPKGNSPSGHADVAGIMMELTADVVGTDTMQDHTGATVTQDRIQWTRNGSWESQGAGGPPHPIGYAEFRFAVMTKYGKTGGRCARD